MPSTSTRSKPGPPASTQLTNTKLLLPFAVLLALSCFPRFAAGQRVTTPTPSPAAPGSSGATPAPRGGGGGGRGDDDGDLSEVCDADGGSADYSEVLM